MKTQTHKTLPKGLTDDELIAKYGKRKLDLVKRLKEVINPPKKQN